MIRQTHTAGFAACIAFFISVPATALADDGSRLIWSPARTGTNAYDLRMGLKLPTAWEIKGGAKVAVAATAAGKLERPAEPFNIWGTIAPPSGDADQRKDMNFDLNTLTGNGGVQTRSVHTRILTPRVDLETSRSISVVFNGYHHHVEALNASVSARLSAQATGTAVIAKATVSSGEAKAFRSLGVEQRLSDNLNLNASYSDAGARPVGVISARFSMSW